MVGPMRRSPAGADDLRRVYAENVEHVYAFFSYSVPRAVAEDLTASTFERVVRSWAGFDPAKASVKTWIATIARNILVDHYRREQHRSGPSTDAQPGLLEGLRSGDDPLGAYLSEDGLRRWLAPLAERERQILALNFALDMAPAEIATVTGLTRANVHQIISRSLRRLREMAESDDAQQPLERRLTGTSR